MSRELFIVEYDAEVTKFTTRDKYLKHIIDKRYELNSFKLLLEEIKSNPNVIQSSIKTYHAETIDL
jgi:hypothetical protein